MSESAISPVDVLLSEDNREELEGIVMQYSLHDKKFFLQCGGVICEGTGVFSEYDFSLKEDNQLYAFLKCYWEMYGGNAQRPGPLGVFTSLANYLVESGAWTDDAVASVKRRLMFLALIPKHLMEPHRPYMADLVIAWLKEVRGAKLLGRVQSRLMNYTEFAEKNNELNAKLRFMEDTKRIFAFGDGMEYVQPAVHRILTPWDRINSVIRGFGKNEADIVICPRAGGKTVFGCQAAGHAALSGYNVMFVTTEQHPDELEARYMSAFADIEFEKISDDLRTQLPKCGPSEINRAMELKRKLKSNLDLVQWKRGDSVKQHLPALIKDYQDRHGTNLDLLVFDWIGKGLGDIPEGDSGALRHLMRGAATAIADSARDFNMGVVTFAQAHVVQSFNKALVDDTMVTEHKQIGEDFTRVFGISTMRSGTDERAQINDDQFFNIAKSRKSQGKAIKITRDFGFQRFKDFEARSKTA